MDIHNLRKEKVPPGVVLAIKLIPGPVMRECRERAKRELAQGKPINRLAAVVIVGLWLLSAVFVIRFVIQVVVK